MNMPQQNGRSVLIAGAGIIGLCSGYALAKAGFRVTLFDPAGPGSQCSWGNAGAISSGSVAPLAMPGVMSDAMSMLFDGDSPLHIPFHYWLKASPWLVRFVASAKPATVAGIAAALHGLLKGAVASHRELARELGVPELVRETGQLHLYPDAQALAKDAAGWELKRQHGLRIERVNRDDIVALEPDVGPAYTTGVFVPDEGWLANPARYCQAMATAITALGGRFVQARIRQLRPADGGWEASDGTQAWRASDALISAGAWSRELLNRIGPDVPLDTQRGYHVQFPHPGLQLSRIVVLADRKLFMTPMEAGLRAAGTVEFGGLERAPTPRRAMLLKKHACAGLPALDTDDATTWMGHRPCLPDSMPVLGAVPGLPGLWCAFGHGHLGITESANTAKLLTRAMAGQGEPAELAPFSVARFA
jgi:D-amino-acid dehydrogenase